MVVSILTQYRVLKFISVNVSEISGKSFPSRTRSIYWVSLPSTDLQSSVFCI